VPASVWGTQPGLADQPLSRARAGRVGSRPILARKSVWSPGITGERPLLVCWRIRALRIGYGGGLRQRKKSRREFALLKRRAIFSR